MAEKEVGSKNPMIDVIESGLQGIHSTTNVLAFIFRKVIWDINIDAPTWYKLLNDWQIMLSKSEMTQKQLASDRGNTIRRLAKDKLQWSGFMLGLHILQIEKVDIEMVFHRNDTILTTVKVTVPIVRKSKPKPINK